jgi:signal transduction histidine kinase
MTPLEVRSANSVESVASTLYDIAHGFDAPVDTEPRLQRALRLLGRIVPNDRAALLYLTAAGPAPLLVEPDASDEHIALRRVLTRFLTILTDDAKAGADWRLPEIGQLALWASPSHLAVPLVGFDEVIGVLFVRHHVANGYTNDHVRLLSIVAGQIAAHLVAVRLHGQYAEMVREHEGSRAEAEAAAGTKDEFLRSLVHDLRALAVTGPIEPMTRLLDGVLDTLRLTRDKVDLHKEPVVFQTIVTAAAKGYAVSASLPDEPLRLEADRARLTQAVVNLLDHAVSRTRAGGGITVTAARERNDVVLRVRVAGTGLVPEIAESSVGLALARTVVVLHGGSVDVLRDGSGPDSELVVRLPLAS